MSSSRLTAATSVVAVVGDPVHHSLSPVIHNAAFESAGLDWVMIGLGVDRARGAGIVDAFRVLGLAGLAVTAPHKEVVAHGVDRLDPAAAHLDSVNTLYRADGAIVGTSTDGDGFVASLSDAEIDLIGVSVVVLGAGGAARSVIDVLGRAGVGRIAVVNRTPERAVSAAELSTVAEAVDPLDVPRAITDADLVVNATTIGMGTDAPMPVAPELLRSHHVVVDLVYHPIDTALLDAARELGARCVDGLGMLIRQAALQQRLWTGHDPDLEAMRSAARSAIARRR